MFLYALSHKFWVVSISTTFSPFYIFLYICVQVLFQIAFTALKAGQSLKYQLGNFTGRF